MEIILNIKLLKITNNVKGINKFQLNLLHCKRNALWDTTFSAADGHAIGGFSSNKQMLCGPSLTSGRPPQRITVE